MSKSNNDNNENINEQEINDNTENVNLNNEEEVIDNDLAKLSDELALAKDSFLRLSAEFDNYRKRTLNEKYELIKTASEDLIKDLLPVIDDFDRALDAISQSGDLDALNEGVKLIYDKLTSLLKSKGLSEVTTLGCDFNPDTHEAIAKVPVDDNKGKVIDIVQKGYSLNDKIIRYPKVVVGE